MLKCYYFNMHITLNSSITALLVKAANEDYDNLSSDSESLGDECDDDSLLYNSSDQENCLPEEEGTEETFNSEESQSSGQKTHYHSHDSDSNSHYQSNKSDNSNSVGQKSYYHSPGSNESEDSRILSDNYNSQELVENDNEKKINSDSSHKNNTNSNTNSISSSQNSNNSGKNSFHKSDSLSLDSRNKSNKSHKSRKNSSGSSRSFSQEISNSRRSKSSKQLSDNSKRDSLNKDKVLFSSDENSTYNGDDLISRRSTGTVSKNYDSSSFDDGTSLQDNEDVDVEQYNSSFEESSSDLTNLSDKSVQDTEMSKDKEVKIKSNKNKNKGTGKKVVYDLKS